MNDRPHLSPNLQTKMLKRKSRSEMELLNTLLVEHSLAALGSPGKIEQLRVRCGWSWLWEWACPFLRPMWSNRPHYDPRRRISFKGTKWGALNRTHSDSE